MKRRNCPYLGLQYDSSTCHAFSSEHNYCHKVSVPGPVDLDYQSAVCLTESHFDCPIYNGVELELPSQPEARLKRSILRYGCIFAAIAIFSVIVALAAPSVSGSSGVRTFLQFLGQPTPERFFTPTPAINLIEQQPPTLTPRSTPMVATDACTPPDGWVRYTLNAGDDLVAIATQRGIDLAGIQSGNCNLDLFSLVAGDEIFLPLPASPMVTDTLDTTATAAPSLTLAPSATLAPSDTPTSLSSPTASFTPAPTHTATPTITATRIPRTRTPTPPPPPPTRKPKPPAEPTQPEERPTSTPPPARP